MGIHAGQTGKTGQKDRYRTKKAQDLRIDPADLSNRADRGPKSWRFGGFLETE